MNQPICDSPCLSIARQTQVNCSGASSSWNDNWGAANNRGSARDLV
jgi:hypothetical protein